MFDEVLVGQGFGQVVEISNLVFLCPLVQYVLPSVNMLIQALYYYAAI
jgi:hypothetical protein